MMLPEERVSSIFVVFVVQIIFAIILLFSLLYGINELILFSLLLLLMGITAYVWSRESIKGIRCTLKSDKIRLFPDEEIQLTIQTVNTRLLPILSTIYLYIYNAFNSTGEHKILSKRNGLLWFQKSSFTFNFTPGKRGVFHVGPLHLRVGDIFGFYKKEKEENTQLEIIVYPRLVKIRPVTIPKREFFGIPGSRSPVKDPAYFLGTRDYQPGQPARNIHWKSSARYRRIQEKIFEPSVHEKVIFIFEVGGFAEKQEEKLFERTIEVLASQAVQLAGEGNGVGLVSNCFIKENVPCIVPASSNRNQISKILEHLARIRMKPVGSIRDILSQTTLMTYGISCLYLSYDKDDRTLATESFLINRNIPTKYIFSKNIDDSSFDKRTNKIKRESLGDLIMKEDF